MTNVDVLDSTHQEKTVRPTANNVEIAAYGTTSQQFVKTKREMKAVTCRELATNSNPIETW